MTPLDLRSSLSPPWRVRVGIGAAVALGVAILIGIFSPRAFFGGYLAAFLLISGLPLGAASLMLTFRLTGGRWGEEATGSGLSLMCMGLLAAPLFILPILLGIPWLYPWHHEAAAVGTFRAMYLNTPAFVLRAAVYAAVWVLLGLSLARTRGELRGAGGWLVLLLVTITFAAVDWFGALAERWHSTIFGFYIILGQALSALAAVILIGTRRKPPPSPDVLHDWGNLLLMCVVLHAYMAYSQFFLIWNGNLPHEIAWYVSRTRGVWGAIAVVLIVIEFLLPFGALLARNAKRQARSLAAIAALIAASRVLDSLWMTLPSLPSGQGLGVLAFVLLAPGLLVFWLLAAAWLQARLLGRRTAREAQT